MYAFLYISFRVASLVLTYPTRIVEWNYLSDASLTAQHQKKYSYQNSRFCNILTEKTPILVKQNNKQKLQILEALYIRIESWVELAILVEGDQKAPFSIVTTPRCSGGATPFAELLHFTLVNVFYIDDC